MTIFLQNINLPKANIVHLLHAIWQWKYEDKDCDSLTRLRKPADTQQQASPWKFKRS